MGFRKSVYNGKCETITPTLVTVDYKTETVVENDETSVNVVPIYRDLLNNEHDIELPSQEEYSLKNLMAAGVNLEEIPVGTLLNPTDVADISDNAENLAASILTSNEINNDEN